MADEPNDDLDFLLSLEEHGGAPHVHNTSTAPSRDTGSPQAAADSDEDDEDDDGMDFLLQLADAAPAALGNLTGQGAQQPTADRVPPVSNGRPVAPAPCVFPPARPVQGAAATGPSRHEPRPQPFGSQPSHTAAGATAAHGLTAPILPGGGYVETNSNIRIVRPLVGSLVVSDRLTGGDRSYRNLKSCTRGIAPSGTWTTLVVLVEKKIASGRDGAPYSRWTVSDLDQTHVTLFLWRKAHDAHWKESEGTVFAVLGSKITREGGVKFSLSVDKPEQVDKLGTSGDWGLCKGERKDGNRCTVPVNRSKCEYCGYHAQAALRKLESNRKCTRPLARGPSILAAAIRPAAQAAMRYDKHHKRMLESAPQPKAPGSSSATVPPGGTGSAAAAGGGRHQSHGERMIQAVANQKATTRYCNAKVDQGDLDRRDWENHVHGRARPVSDAKSRAIAALQSQQAVAPSTSQPTPPPAGGTGPSSSASARVAAAAGSTRPTPAVPPAAGQARDATGAHRPLSNSAPAVNDAREEDEESGSLLGRAEAVAPPSKRRAIEQVMLGSGRREVPGPRTTAAVAAVASGRLLSERGASPCDDDDEDELEIVAAGDESASCVSGDVPRGLDSRTSDDAQVTDDAGEGAQAGSRTDTAALSHGQAANGGQDGSDGELDILFDDEAAEGTAGRSPLHPDSSRACTTADGRTAGDRIMIGGIPGGTTAGGGTAALSTARPPDRADHVGVGPPGARQRSAAGASSAAGHPPGARVVVPPGATAKPQPHPPAPATGLPRSVPPAASAGPRPILGSNSALTNTVPIRGLSPANAASAAPIRGLGPANAKSAAQAAAAAALQKNKALASIGIKRGATAQLTGPKALAPNGAFGMAPSTATGASRLPNYQVPGQGPPRSAMAAAFGEVTKVLGNESAVSRYADVADEAEWDGMMARADALQQRDALQQKLEATTKLQVTAFSCKECAYISEKRRPGCSNHTVTRVSTTKRWWKCGHCGGRTDTVGVIYPTNRCPKCNDPGKAFTAVTMYAGPTKPSDALPDTGPAQRASFKARGTEHAFALR